MESRLKLQLHTRVYTPNYQNPDAALEGILGGAASAETPSTSTVTAAVTEAVVTPASWHTNLRQRPQTRATGNHRSTHKILWAMAE